MQVRSASFLTSVVSMITVSSFKLRISAPAWSGKLRFGSWNCISSDQSGQRDYGLVFKVRPS
ncbi:hypothetical protein BIFGAL_04142 [Bifidobacterium gallicum DSM 20093 = LMG 11596]|uniref:Uncharacterized protein n=1 Tax=Bifidobacterium gallicum DSM 20093 = LMG 11596 TaxID=561180 RepID=D1NW95_9BIFI|nr:hypothetical protein BIFGAL_04142 [Bifidobacterium gallicum DSM 20093 = LMG 11596]